jgi:RNA polymerase sigma factor (sigma-70 family)
MIDAYVESDVWVSQTYTDVVRSLSLYCGDQSTAEDCAQEALFRLWRRRRDVEDPRAWVFRCAFNIASSTFRRRAAERRALHRSGQQMQPTSTPTAPIERDLDLYLGLAALSDRQRQAVLLRYLADFDLPRVALAMGCSSGTVKAHLARGLAALRNSELISDAAESLDRP